MKGTDGRLYYSIGEVCEMLNIRAHTLHYWENAFPVLKPHKNNAGNRCYRPKDIEIIKSINKLLNEEGYSIDGARKQLEQAKKQNSSSANANAVKRGVEKADSALLDEVCSELESIIKVLSRLPRADLDD